MTSGKKRATVAIITIIILTGLFANLYLTGHLRREDIKDGKKRTEVWEKNTDDGTQEDIDMLDYGDMDFINGGYYKGRLSSNVRIDGNIEDLSAYVGNYHKCYKIVTGEDRPINYKGSEEYELIEEFMRNNIYDYKGGEEYHSQRDRISYSVYSYRDDALKLSSCPLNLGRNCIVLGRYDTNYRHEDYLPYDMAEKFMNNFNAFTGMNFQRIRYMAITKSMIDKYNYDFGYDVMQREIIYNRLSKYGNMYYAECSTSMNGIKMAHNLCRLEMVLTKNGVISLESCYGFRPDTYVYDGEVCFSDKAVENALRNCVSAVGGKCRGEAVIRDVGVYYDYNHVTGPDGGERIVVCPRIVITVYYDEAVKLSPGALNQYRFYDIENGGYTGRETTTGV